MVQLKVPNQEKTQQEETPKSSVKEEKKEEQKTSTQDSSTPAPTPSKPATENEGEFSDGDAGGDPLFEEAKSLVIEKQSNTPTSENKTNQ
ncbi:DNA translocase FtsK [Streptococcus pneumoniae]|nr:DNA translocase FtsK [Streptococcus pneumoniae]